MCFVFIVHAVNLFGMVYALDSGMKPNGKQTPKVNAQPAQPETKQRLRQVEECCLRELIYTGANGQHTDSRFIQKALAVFRPSETDRRL